VSRLHQVEGVARCRGQRVDWIDARCHGVAARCHRHRHVGIARRLGRNHLDERVGCAVADGEPHRAQWRTDRLSRDCERDVGRTICCRERESTCSAEDLTGGELEPRRPRTVVQSAVEARWTDFQGRGCRCLYLDGRNCGVQPHRQPISTRQEYPGHREPPCSKGRGRGRRWRRRGAGRGRGLSRRCAAARRLSGGVAASTQDRKAQERREDQAFTHEPMLGTEGAARSVYHRQHGTHRWAVHIRRTGTVFGLQPVKSL
jgi:hypothetical protein